MRRVRPRREQVQAQPFGQEFRDQLAFDAVARFVERGREDADGSLAGRDGHDAAAHTTLAGQADLEQPVAGLLVQSRRCQCRQHAPAMRRVDHPFAGDRVDPSIGQRGTHDSQILGGYVQGTLAGVDIGGFQRVAVHAAVAFQQLGDAAVAQIGGSLGLIDFLVDFETPASEPRESFLDEAELFRRRGARHAARRCDRTGIDHRVHRAVRVEFDCHDRVERQSRRIDANLVSRRFCTDRLAHQREDEWL